MEKIFGLIIFILSCSCVKSSDCRNDVEVACYWGSWSMYRIEDGKFTAANIDPSLCTNIIYSFVGLNLKDEVESLDENVDFQLGGFSSLVALKKNNNCLKTTLAIGGWNEGSIKYSVMAATEESRNSFAKNVLRYLVYYGFDGLDMDWEYPTIRGGIPEDGKNFAALVKVIKETISPWGLILTAAVPIDDSLIGTAYDVPVIAEFIDYIHLMAYDYVPTTTNVTGLSSPLSAIKKTVSSWINAGLPSKKLILGLPTYARCFALKSSDHHNIGDPISGLGIPGMYTSEAGLLAYYEVLNILAGGDMTIVNIDDTNYAYDDSEWITFETQETIRIKTKYALEQNLGGLMVWSLDTDDFNGLYGEKYPLLTAINREIKENRLRTKP